MLLVYLLIYFPCSLSLLFHVQSDNVPNLHGKKKVRKTTQARGSGLDLTKIAAEQQNKLKKDKEEMISAIMTAMPEKEAAASGDSDTSASGSGIGSVPKGHFAIGSSAGSESGLGSTSSEIGRTGKDEQLLNILVTEVRNNYL